MIVDIGRVGVVGAGVMGSGIAQWLAAHGIDVVIRDVDEAAVSRAIGISRRLFEEAVKRGKLTAAEANSGLQRIATTTTWEGFETCDLVIEAIVEKMRAKQALFSELAEVVKPTTLLASNTSALPIEEIAGHIANPARTLGIHFFNPVSRMSLVEVVVGRHTAPDPVRRALGLVRALGKFPIECRSSPGFLVTRVLFFYLNHAVRLREEGDTTAEIDAAMREFGWPMGPLRLIDEVGLDVTDSIFHELAHYFPKRFSRTTTCARMLERNLLGRKNGASRGFYRYENREGQVNDEVDAAIGPVGTPAAHAGKKRPRTEIMDTLMRVLVEEAQRCLDEGVVRSAGDIDAALLRGAGFPASRGGLMQWARLGAKVGA